MGEPSRNAVGRRVRFRPHLGFVAATGLFAAVFVAVVLSAFHAPSPHGLPVGIVAPATVTGQVEEALGSAAPGSFNLQVYDSEAAARAGITHNELDGALIDDHGGMQLLIARADGASAAQALITAFDVVAARSGQLLAVTDVVPPLPGDSMALSPFFVVLGVLFPSLVAGSSSALVFRRARPAWCVAAPMVAAVVAGAVAAGIADGIAGLGHYPAIAGIAALFALAVAAPTAALARIWPPLVAAAVLVFVILALPASGGPSGLAAFVPGFLRVLHPAVPLATAASAVRAAVYFDGYGAAGPLWALTAWAAGGVAALTLVTAWRRAQPRLAPVQAAGLAAADAQLANPQLADGLPVGIVAGFDNSEPARRALGQAARLAAARHGTLHIVYADHPLIDSDLSGFGHAEIEATRDQDAAAVAEAAAGIATQEGAQYTFDRYREAPADAILSAADTLAMAPGSGPVIVVGRSGHTARHLLGSVPAHLLHHSPYPVLTIP